MKCGPKCWATGSIELRSRKLETCLHRVATAIRFGNTNRAGSWRSSSSPIDVWSNGTPLARPGQGCSKRGSSVYGCLLTGWTRDLKEAKTLLEELAA